MASQPGNKIVFSKLVENEGLFCFSLYLKLFGVQSLENTKNDGTKNDGTKNDGTKNALDDSERIKNSKILWGKPIFVAELTGKKTFTQNENLLRQFNDPNNCYS
jgi:hypothetical protein